MEARALGQPIPDEGGLVRPVVVHDEMGVQRARDRRINRVEELAEFGRAMASMKLRDQLAGFHIELGEQGRRAMPFVIVRAPFDLPRPHRQQRLRAVKG